MILVTGAAGFIGSNLVATLNEAGREDLILCDHLSHDGRWQNLRKRCFSHFLMPDQLFGHLNSVCGEAIELVLHMGAISDTTVQDGDQVVRTNYQLTKMLWDWCAEHDAIFVYASSAATYGHGEHGFSDASNHSELKALRPLNLYGWSKHVFDLYASGEPSVSPKRWYGLKFFNVFGPNEYHKGAMRSVICKLGADILAGRTIQLFASHEDGFADGGQLRDFIDVFDACKATLHLGRGDAPSGIYNIGTGKARSFADMMTAAFLSVGHEPRIEYIAMPETIRTQYQYYTQADTQRLRELAGFGTPFASLENSVSRFLTSYLAKKDRFR